MQPSAGEGVAPLKASLLVVEDDDDILQMLRHFLANKGLHCVFASTLLEAKGAIAAAQFDFILLDLVLPDGSGLDLMPAIAAGANRGAYVMISSGNVSNYVRSLPGIARIFEKPYNFRDVLNHIGEKSHVR